MYLCISFQIWFFPVKFQGVPFGLNVVPSFPSMGSFGGYWCTYGGSTARDIIKAPVSVPPWNCIKCWSNFHSHWPTQSQNWRRRFFRCFGDVFPNIGPRLTRKNPPGKVIRWRQKAFNFNSHIPSDPHIARHFWVTMMFPCSLFPDFSHHSIHLYVVLAMCKKKIIKLARISISVTSGSTSVNKTTHTSYQKNIILNSNSKKLNSQHKVLSTAPPFHFIPTHSPHHKKTEWRINFTFKKMSSKNSGSQYLASHSASKSMKPKTCLFFLTNRWRRSRDRVFQLPFLLDPKNKKVGDKIWGCYKL